MKREVMFLFGTRFRSLFMSNYSAGRTMTEFNGLELVTMIRVNSNNNNASKSEYMITLNPKFEWFLTNEFQELRDGYQPTNYKKDMTTTNKKKYAATKNTPTDVTEEVDGQQDAINENNDEQKQEAGDNTSNKDN